MLGIESAYDKDEVWIVSPDLSNVADGMPIRNVVKDNIEKGIIYIYFISDSNDVFANRRNLEHTFDKKSLKFVELKDEYWGEHFPTHMIIFNPNCKNGEPVLYFELPLTEAGACAGHWVLASRKMSHHTVRALHSKLRA